MGLYSGSASYIRYKITGEPPENIKQLTLLKLKEFSFKELDQLSTREKSIGWVSAENLASVMFDDYHFSKDPYCVFSLRIDTRCIPPLALKAALLRDEMKFKKSTGKEKLAKRDKDSLKEQVKDSLMKKVLPCPDLYDVCWNTSTGIVLFFSTSKKANMEFMDFFYASFDLQLTPLSPLELASALVATKKDKMRLEKLSSPLG
jgi:DNA recombination-dependent growth factor C